MRASWLILLLVSLAEASCGAAKDCPNDLPAACPAVAPSYATSIAPIIQTYCVNCHSPGGRAPASWNFSSYSDLKAHSGSVLDQVYACNMPLAGSPGLPAADRTALLGWLVCGDPNN